MDTECCFHCTPVQNKWEECDAAKWWILTSVEIWMFKDLDEIT